MDSTVTYTPKSLRILASTVEFEHGNYLLHEYVSVICDSNRTVSEECIKATLRLFNGTPVNELNDYGYCALHLAVLASNVPMMRMLLSCIQNIDANKRCVNGDRTALHLAAIHGGLPMVQELISNEVNAADIRFLDFCDESVFDHAIESGSLLTLQYLLSKCDIVNFIDDFGYNPLKKAVCFKNTHILEWLLEIAPYKNLTSNNLDTLLLEASRVGNLDIIKILVTRGAFVNAVDDLLNTPLHYLLQSGNLEAISFLLSKNAIFNFFDKNGKNLLNSTVIKGNFEVLKYIGETIEDLNIKDKNGCIPLHDVVKYGDLQKVSYFVYKKKDVNARDNFGNSPIHNAAYYGNLDIIMYLIQENADPYVVNDNGETVYHFAAKNRHLNVIMFFQEMGVLFKDGSNIQPILCIAARSRDLKILKIFIEQCGDVNVQDKHGRSPLFYASAGGCVEMVKELLKRGSLITSENNPLFAAVGNRPAEIVQLLLENWG